jgi:signal transduction histidine kinase
MAVAEELKLPLMHIARTAELQALSGRSGALPEPQTGLPSLLDIQQTADMTVQLLDNYLLSLRLAAVPDGELHIEAVPVAAVLQDAVAQLGNVARQYGVELELKVQGRFQPVITDRRALRGAMVSLGYALIEALPAAGVSRLRLQLAAHRTKYGIVAGVYGELDELTPRQFRRAFELQGAARQPLVSSLPGSGAGIFVADAILTALSRRLRVGRFNNLPGFAVTLPASEQLQLV